MTENLLFYSVKVGNLVKYCLLVTVLAIRFVIQQDRSTSKRYGDSGWKPLRIYVNSVAFIANERKKKFLRIQEH